MSKIICKIKEVGISNTLIGSYKLLRYKRLQKDYGFDPWHTSPYELRKYAQDVAKYINDNLHRESTVVDIGCGLGEVLRNVKAKKRVGLDLDEAAIKCARMLDRSKTIEYEVGTFENFEKGQIVDFLITLSFMHGSREDSWREPYHNFTEKNDVRNIIVDVVPEGVDGAKELDFSKILPECYTLTKRMGPYLSGRYIEIYTKS